MNWMLVETWATEARSGKNKGNMVEREHRTFYGSLDSLCRHCIDKSLDPEGGFEQMLAQLVNVRADLEKLIKKQGVEAKVVIREAMGK